MFVELALSSLVLGSPAIDESGNNLCPSVGIGVSVVLVQSGNGSCAVSINVGLEVGDPSHVVAAVGQVVVRLSQEGVGDDADSVLGFLCNAYYDQNCNSDSEETKQAFEELYEAMNGKTLREKDEVIYAVCRLCRSHQQTGFVDGINLGLRLSQELKN